MKSPSTMELYAPVSEVPSGKRTQFIPATQAAQSKAKLKALSKLPRIDKKTIITSGTKRTLRLLSSLAKNFGISSALIMLKAKSEKASKKTQAVAVTCRASAPRVRRSNRSAQSVATM